MNNLVRPHQLLPLPEPSKFDPSTEDTQYFYKNFASQFIENMIEMTNAGIHIDSGAVESLRVQVTSVLKDVEKRLGRSPVIRKFQEIRAKKLQEQHAEKATQAIRVLGDFLRPYNEKDITHRTWVINTYLINSGFPKDTKDKWTLKCVKDYCIWNSLPFLEAIKARKDISNFPITKEGMVALAEHKLDLWNKPRYESAANPVKVPPFNAGSSKQKQELFSSLNIAPLEFSKTTGEGSWGREQLEILLKTTVNEELKEVLKAFIDHSFSGIIRNTFLKAFDSYTIDGTLYGNIKLFGAKSFRPTSNNPNLLNMPSTGSVYAKPLKQCFNAPEGYLVWSIDYAALEERVLASLSKDKNKCAIFQQGLDSHCFNAMGYFTEEIGTHIKLTGDLVEDTKTFKAAIDNGNKELKAIRQKSKPINFKLNYQGMADADKGGVITQEIYEAYHEKLYKQVGEFRDDMISTAKEKGYVHLGLGCRIYTEDPAKEYRTLFNAYGGQFWSILSLIAINELNYQKKEAGLDNDIIVNATIYDSIYGYVKKDAETIKWLNETIVPIMEKDFVDNQIIKNSADLCIGTTWANVEDTELPKEISLIEIEELIKEF